MINLIQAAKARRRRGKVRQSVCGVEELATVSCQLTNGKYAEMHHKHEEEMNWGVELLENIGGRCHAAPSSTTLFPFRVEQATKNKTLERRMERVIADLPWRLLWRGICTYLPVSCRWWSRCTRRGQWICGCAFCLANVVAGGGGRGFWVARRLARYWR